MGSLGSLTSLSAGGSTTLAEAAGHNRFSTGTLSASDLANHADVKGSSIGLGASGGVNSSGSGDGVFDQRQSTSDKSGLASLEASGSVGFGQVSDSEGSTTYSGINTKNILITDAAKQTLLTGLSAEAMADRVFTATTTENAEALSGALENRFDAAALQKELDTQRAVSQAFSQNVQSAKAELNQAADRLTADYEAGRISQAEYDAKRQQLDNGALLLSTIAAGLSAPTDSALGIATATLSPSFAKEIGQYFKSTNREGSTEHLIAHGLLAAAVAATGGNNALSAAGAAMSAEAAAPMLAHYLYGKEAADLNADEKATISSITSLVGAGVGGITGTDSGIAQGAKSAGTAVDNNWMSDYRGIFGVNQWGPGAASLVDAKLKENPDITPEELQSELKDYMTGAGYESGVSDGVVVWMVAPSAALGAGATTAAVAPGVIAMIPSLGTGLKVYGLASLESVTGGIGTSSFLNEDYKLSNLAYDLSVGVVIDSTVKKLIEKSAVKGVSKRYVETKGAVTNHFLGDGVSSAISNKLGSKDATLVPKTNWPKLLRSNDD
ncbi:Possible hemagglutinin (DUF638) [Oligella ureolytica]|uniref:Possible hemagglutinin (DUF638) n=3 Tax=Oligella ureolytica TaxID=90244 RepID=A0A378XDJ7_9BURK|nr:VENN motif pre-toxin domain-containing protein [Oligella ureolytica]SUA53350.1 Possible hemagglutinin (DUF638) [Oligella ureolytica]